MKKVIKAATIATTSDAVASVHLPFQIDVAKSAADGITVKPRTPRAAISSQRKKFPFERRNADAPIVAAHAPEIVKSTLMSERMLLANVKDEPRCGLARFLALQES